MKTFTRPELLAMCAEATSYRDAAHRNGDPHRAQQWHDAIDRLLDELNNRRTPDDQSTPANRTTH